MSNENGGGISFCGLLTIVFITLKLTGYIDWSWFWVLSPLLIPVIFVLVFFLGAFTLLRFSRWNRTNGRR